MDPRFDTGHVQASQAGYRVGQLTAAHARCAARLHMAGQPGTFLTQLGLDALTSIYSVLPQAGFGFVVDRQSGSQSQIGGFISGASGIGGLMFRLFTHRGGRVGLRFTATVATRALRRPILFRYALETLLYPFSSGHAAAAPADSTGGAPGSGQGSTGQTLELLSIMVEPQLRSRGIGSRLMRAFLDECASRGAGAVDVTVDAANQHARRFYTQHQFALVHEFRLYGRTMCQYRNQTL